MEDLVALLQAAEDGNRVLHAGLIHLDRLEAALQSRVLLNILAVFVQRRCAEAVQLSARQHGLEQVACIHRALGLTGADDGMKLVDKKQDLPVAPLDLVQNRLEAFLKLAAEFCTGDQSAHVQGEDGLVLEALGDVLAHDPLGQALDNGRLAHAGLTDQNGVVLRLAGENPDHVADLFITADDRVHLLVPGALDQVGAEALQRLVSVLRIVGRHALTAADLGEGLQSLLTLDLIGRKELLHRGVRTVDHRKEEMLHRNEIILHGLRQGFRMIKELIHRAGNVVFVGFPAGAGHSGKLAELFLHRRVQAFGRLAHALEKLRDQPLLLPQQ